MKIKMFLIGLIALLVFSNTNAIAQDYDDTDMQEESRPGDPVDPDAPIDGGLSVLIAAGVAYGAKKGYDQKKKTKQMNSL